MDDAEIRKYYLFGFAALGAFMVWKVIEAKRAADARAAASNEPPAKPPAPAQIQPSTPVDPAKLTEVVGPRTETVGPRTETVGPRTETFVGAGPSFETGREAGTFDAQNTAYDYSLSGAPVFITTTSYEAAWAGTDAAEGYRQGFAEATAAAGLVLDGDPLSGSAMVYAQSSESDAEGRTPISPVSTPQTKIYAEQAGEKDGLRSVEMSRARGGAPVAASHDEWREAWQGTEAGEAYRSAFRGAVASAGYQFDGAYVGMPGAALEAEGSGDTSDISSSVYDMLFGE
jgi:hypothetical protein